MREVILGIETSHDLGGVALTRGEECIKEVPSSARLKHSEELVILIDTALKTSGLTLEDVDGIAVSIGPGSFTGLRVGLSTAKGLCLSTGLPMLVVPTLDALASIVKLESAPVHAIIDAKRGEVYWASYEFSGECQRRTGGYEAVSPEGLIERISSEVLLLGSGLDRYREFILENARVPVRLIDPNPRFPSPTAVSLLGYEKLKSGVAQDMGSVEPIYIRPSDAETGRRSGRNRT